MKGKKNTVGKQVYSNWHISFHFLYLDFLQSFYFILFILIGFATRWIMDLPPPFNGIFTLSC